MINYFMPHYESNNKYIQHLLNNRAEKIVLIKFIRKYGTSQNYKSSEKDNMYKQKLIITANSPEDH